MDGGWGGADKYLVEDCRAVDSGRGQWTLGGARWMVALVEVRAITRALAFSRVAVPLVVCYSAVGANDRRQVTEVTTT